jgi:uracil DNA glycosylase
MDINSSRPLQHQVSHKALVLQTALRNPWGWQGILFLNKILAVPISKSISFTVSRAHKL